MWEAETGGISENTVFSIFRGQLFFSPPTPTLWDNSWGNSQVEFEKTKILQESESWKEEGTISDYNSDP